MTASLVVILSVFNGFDSLIRSMINQFDPDLKVTAAQGKTFMLDPDQYQLVSQIDGVQSVSLNVQETALFQYDNYQYIATLKGVDDNYPSVCNIPDNIYVGDYILRDSSNIPFAVVGAEIASHLWMQVNGFTPIKVYAPLRHDKVSINPDEAFARANVMPGGVFHIHQDFDSKYVLVPLDFARDLLEYDDHEISSIEISCMPSADEAIVVAKIREILGDGVLVKNRFQQQDMLYKIMKSEKLSIFVMLSFIIVIASFNIIGALSMLIIDKKRDIQILSHLGANQGFVKSIFRITGQLITLVGVVSGVAFGLLVCWAQLQFQFLKFPDGAFIIDAYPVEIQTFDVFVSILVVIVIGFAAAMIPTRKIDIE